MKFTRNRISFALIGLLLVGGVSAAVAVLTTPHPARLALADVRRGNAAPTATAMDATATTANVIATATSGTSSAAPTATTPPAPQPTNTPFTLVPGQSVGLQGQVSNVNVNAGTFTLTTSNGATTVNVSSGTNWSGAVTDLSKLPNGGFAEVHGVVQANGSLKATEVNASSDN